MTTPKNRLFPKNLEQGAKGPAVRILQIILKARLANVRINGHFDRATADAVATLQTQLGFAIGGVDSKFGPKTRARLKKKLRIDVNAFMIDDFTGSTTAI